MAPMERVDLPSIMVHTCYSIVIEYAISQGSKNIVFQLALYQNLKS